jgi:hypothetical protein
LPIAEQVKIGIGIVFVLAAAVLYFQSRDGAAAGIRECMKKAGATVRKSEQFARAFPYLEAATSGNRVQSHPEFHGSSIYAVIRGDVAGLLFVGDDDDDVRTFEHTMRAMDASLTAARSRQAGNTLLLWLQPPATAFDPIGDCVR